MNRLSTVLWILVIVVATVLLYQVKYKVQSIRNQVAETSHQLEEEKEALHVSAAEWAYLNRPERLERLADEYLGSSDLTVTQVADLKAIPFPEKMEASLADSQAIAPAAFHLER